MIICVSTVHQLNIAVDMYFHWVSLRKLVYAVDKRHKCAYPTDFESAKDNGHPIVKVILFDHNSYYAVQLMDRVFQEEIPGRQVLMFYCPLCLEGFWNPPIYQ